MVGGAALARMLEPGVKGLKDFEKLSMHILRANERIMLYIVIST